MHVSARSPSWVADGVREHLRRMPVENIAELARGTTRAPDFIPLWFGEGDLPTPQFAADAVARALAAGHVFYTQQNGVTELRIAIGKYLTGLGCRTIPPERVTVTAGGMGAILLAVSLVLDHGDNVVIVDPVWPNIAGAVRMVGGTPRPVPMDLTPAGWQLDLAKLEACFDRRTKAVFFASPGNPTGAIIPVETQRAILDLCRQRGVWVIADEVYNRMVFGQRAAASIADIADPEDRVLIVNSFSKSWAMTGWRLGWLVHPPALESLLANMTQFSNSGLPTFLQYAATTVLRDGEPFVAHMNRYSEHGVQLVCNALERMGRVRLVARPPAAMYVFFGVDGMTDSRTACREIAQRAQVGLAPGALFGSGFDGFLRMCCCRAPGQLDLAMERLRPLLG
jgi:aspartate/methionine/tyrosine aminotransferase